MRWLAVALLAPALLACEERTYEIDPFPLPVDLTAGVPVASATAAELDDVTRTVVLDTASPLTILEESADAPLDRRSVTLTLHEASGGARARFELVDVLVAPAGSIGETAVGVAAGTPVTGVIGADVLKRVAVRLDASAGTVRFFPDVAGDSSTLEESCRAVLDAPLVGGGSYSLGEEDVDFDASRVVVDACLGVAPSPRVDELPDGDLDLCRAVPVGGRDALLVVASGLPITVLTRTAYEAAGGVELPASPDTRIHLPGGDFIDAKRGTISSIVLTHDASDARGACEETLVGRQQERGGCRGVDDCACDGTDQTCAAGAAVELGWTRDVDEPTVTPPSIPVAVIENTHPLIQGYRRELSPEVADVDGLLGMDLLGKVVVDLDYPHGRLIFRCADAADQTCLVRPGIANQDQRAERAACLTTAFLTSPCPN